MVPTESLEKLDPREVHFRVSGPIERLKLFLRHLAPVRPTGRTRAVLFVHGMSFPSALSIAHRFDGRSWRDELCDTGFDVWGLDFYGFGYSDRYAEMSQPAEQNPPLGQAAENSQQIECAARFICAQSAAPRISLIAHSGGTIGTAIFAIRNPELADRLVFFAPIARREPTNNPVPRLPAWRLISLEDQWERFTEEVPEGQPGHVRAPLAIVRDEWDSMCTDADARWLFDALSGSPTKRDVKISRATHLMHLEKSRYALYRETQTFLEGETTP